MTTDYGSFPPSKMPKQILNRSLVVDVLCILFGISSWVEINGLWVEMPLLVQKLPEQWNLPSYIVVFTQIANVGPILYSIASKKWSFKVLQTPVIHFTLAVGSISCFLLTFLWSRTTYLFGEMRSTALLSLGFSLAMVDCTSSVLYLPFMANYKGKYVISYLIGEGMSGLIPGIVALIQGVGGNTKCREVNVTDDDGNTTIRHEQYYGKPRFSVEIFFGFLFVMMMLSWLAFILLRILSVAKKEMIAPSNEMTTISKSEEVKNDAGEENCAKSKFSIAEPALDRGLSRKVFGTFLTYQCISCALSNGVLPSIQSYSCLPYGNTAYHLTVTLTSIANPVACFIAMLLPTSSVPLISSYFAGGGICSLYLVATAALSPTPPFVGTQLGEIVIVVLWVSFVALLSYAKACMASLLHKGGGHSALFWAGVVTQIGSALGALLMFFVINYGNVFHGINPCSR